MTRSWDTEALHGVEGRAALGQSIGALKAKQRALVLCNRAEEETILPEVNTGVIKSVYEKSHTGNSVSVVINMCTSLL